MAETMAPTDQRRSTGEWDAVAVRLGVIEGRTAQIEGIKENLDRVLGKLDAVIGDGAGQKQYCAEAMGEMRLEVERVKTTAIAAQNHSTASHSETGRKLAEEKTARVELAARIDAKGAEQDKRIADLETVKVRAMSSWKTILAIVGALWAAITFVTPYIQQMRQSSTTTNNYQTQQAPAQRPPASRP